MFLKRILVFLIVTIFATSHASIGGYICPYSRKKFLEIATRALNTNTEDISVIYFGANSFKLLNEALPKDLKTASCEKLNKLFKPTADLSTLFYGLSTNKLLGCDSKLSVEGVVKIAQEALQSDVSSVLDLHYASEILTLLGQPLSNQQKIVQLIQAQLKTDDSVLNLGYALHIAALLGNSGKFIINRIEDIVVQADEVDGKLLQWEGGLSTTSQILPGLLKFPTSNQLTQVQADKLGNYLLSRTTVQTPKGVSVLLEAVTALAASKISPVSISIAGPTSVTVNKPELRIQVTNILGQPLKPTPSPVVAQSATRIADDVVVLAKQPLSPGTKESEFILPLKLEPGFYKILINAGTHAATLNARVLGPIEIKNFEIGLSDADGSSVPKLEKITFPNKCSKILKGDSGQNLLVKFTLSQQVHQAFLRLSAGKKEIIFVAGYESNNQYKIEADLGQELPLSDTFTIELIIGDSIITNPIRWNVGNIEVKLSGAATQSVGPKIIRSAKPEIVHMFRQPDKRPAEVVSLFFTALTLTPFLVLLVSWKKIGVNFSNFTPLAIPFHLGFGAILGLFALFWLKLNMFATCAYLIPIGGFTFFAGQRLLSHVAKNKKPEKADK